MNCVPELVSNQLGGETHLHLVCRVHGFVADASSHRYHDVAVPYVYLLDQWGKHVLKPTATACSAIASFQDTPPESRPIPWIADIKETFVYHTGRWIKASYTMPEELPTHLL